MSSSASKRLLEDDGLPMIVHVREPNDKLWTAFMASIVASMATINFGYALGYSSPTESKMSGDKPGDALNPDQFSWFSVCHVITYFFMYNLIMR
jgi:hypothetical protein